MAGLQTGGFALSALPRAPVIPDNVGKLDVAQVYDSVVKGMQTSNALRTALARQQAEDETLKAQRATALAQQAVIPAAAMADVATANRSTALASPSIVGQEVANKGTALDADLAAEQSKRDVGRFIGSLTPAQQFILAKNGPETTSTSSTELNPDGTVVSTSSKDATVGGQTFPLARSETSGPFALMPGVPGAIRTFQQMTAGMTPEDREKARRVQLGLDGRASNAGQQSIEVKQPDGSVVRMTFNPRTGAYDIPEIPLAAAVAGAEEPPIGFRSQNTAENQSDKTRAAKTEELKVEKTAALPKAQQAIRDWDANSTNVLTTLDDVATALKEFGPTSSGIQRKLAARVPGTDAYNIKHALDTVLANVAFDKLSAMRAASKTGGALGNVSDADLRLLQSSIASLDLGQDISTILGNIEKVKSKYEQLNQSQHQAFEQEYKDLIAPTAAAQEAALTKAPTVTTQAEYDALPPDAPFLTPSGKPRKKQ